VSGLNPLHLTRRGTAGAADSSRQSSKYPATIYGNAIRSRTRLSYSGSKPLNSPQPKHLGLWRVHQQGGMCRASVRVADSGVPWLPLEVSQTRPHPRRCVASQNRRPSSLRRTLSSPCPLRYCERESPHERCDPSLARRHKNQACFGIVDVGISPGADRE